jgi:serine/threonine-protein kinase RsbW
MGAAQLCTDSFYRMIGGSMTGSDGAAGSDDRMIELRLPSRLGYEKVAMDMAASLARRMGFGADRIEALRTALAEAVTNAIEHGNAHDAEMKVTVLLTPRPDELIVSVADQGRRPLETSQTELQPQIDQTIARGEAGGWGIWLMKELMDEVEFSSVPNGGNRVRMVIYLEQP